MSLCTRALGLSLALAGAVLAGGTVADEVAVLQDHDYGNYWKRLAAVKRLGKIGSKEAAQALCDLLADADPPVREQAVLELAGLEDKDAIDPIPAALTKAKDPLARANAAWALRLLGHKDTLPHLLAALADPDARVRASAAEAVGALGDAACAQKLLARLGDSDAKARTQVALALGSLKDASAFAPLAKKLSDSNGLFVGACLRSLSRIDPQKALPLLEEKLKERQDEPKIAAIGSMASFDPQDATRAAAALLQDAAWPVRAAAIHALLVSWQKDGITALVDRLPKEKGRLRYDIVMALREMSGKAIGFDPRDWKAWWDANRDAFQMPEKKKGGPRGAEPEKSGDTQVSFFDIPLLSDRVCFIIDFSGSMKTAEDNGEKKARIALDELEKTVGRLKPEVKFTVILLSTEATALKLRTISRKLVPATDANKKLALAQVNEGWARLGHDKRGRGDHYDAVMEAFEDPEVDTVILVSDGVPTYGQYVDEGDVVEYLGRENEYRRVMIHCVLTGTKGTSPRFMTDLAEATGGMFVRK